MEELKTIFRKYPNGDIIALFPECPANVYGSCIDSYQHIGQHGAADYHHVMGGTRPASPTEYAELLKELQGYDFGSEYKIVPVKRMTRFVKACGR